MKAALRDGRFVGFVVVVAVAFFGACSRPAPPSEPIGARSAALTASPVDNETALATAYAAKAAIYSQTAATNRAVAADLTAAVAKQAEIAAATQAAVEAGQAASGVAVDPVSVDPVSVDSVSVDPVSLAPASVGVATVAVDDIAPDRVAAQRESAATLADTLAARAQKAADFHTAKANEIAAITAGADGGL